MLDPAAALSELAEAEGAGRLPELVFFWGHRPKADGGPGPWVFSQWWPAPFEAGGVRYHHAEGFMMAAKARLFGDDSALPAILAAEDPAEAKRLGQAVRGFDEQRWREHRFGIVVEANHHKFTADDHLLRYLLATHPKVLVEASPVDRVWGIGLAASDPAARRPSRWRGLNLLGFALMEVRERMLAR